MPKSITLMSPFRVTITLPGLMSRCTMPAWWLYSRARSTPEMISRVRSGSSRWPSISRSLTVLPSTNSITMNGIGHPGRHVLAGVVHGDDRRVVQRCGGLRLAAETRLEGLVPREIGAEGLDRDHRGRAGGPVPGRPPPCRPARRRLLARIGHRAAGAVSCLALFQTTLHRSVIPLYCRQPMRPMPPLRSRASSSASALALSASAWASADWVSPARSGRRTACGRRRGGCAR